MYKPTADKNELATTSSDRQQRPYSSQVSTSRRGNPSSDTPAKNGWDAAWGITKNVFTLGGAGRLERAQERIKLSKEKYDAVLVDLRDANAKLYTIFGRIKRAVPRTKKRFGLAKKMLDPRSLRSGNQRSANLYSPASHRVTASLVRMKGARGNANAEQLVGIGAASGVVAAIVAWEGIQILGTASTGTAIGGIYGAAAQNAGWAAFGGGSLASGGGGIAMGHLVLPGIGVAVAVGVAAYATHSEANDLNTASDSLDSATRANDATLLKVISDSMQMLRAEQIYATADERLSRAVRTARWQLRRFGWFSVLYRYLRFKMKGVYYTPRELWHVQNLEDAVQAFMASFGVE